jgi:hypothetical protein
MKNLGSKNKKRINWTRQLERLTKYAANRGYMVVFEKSAENQDSVDPERKVIRISTGHTNEMAFYCFLHELGHVVLMDDHKKYKHSYGIIWNSFSGNSLTLRVTTLQEELDAWREGLKLSRRLKLKVNRRKFEIVKAKCIATYLPWAARRSAL